MSIFDVVVDRQNRQYFDIFFDKPLGQGKVGEVLDPAPAAIFPSLGGSWKWQDTNALRFEPSGGLPVASEFKVEIEPEKVVQEGQVFTGDTEVTVKTDKFLVEDVTVFEEPALEGKGKVTFRGEMKFNYPVDPKTLAPLVKVVDSEVSEPVPVVLEIDWNSNVVGYHTEPVQKQRDERTAQLVIAAAHVRRVRGLRGSRVLVPGVVVFLELVVPLPHLSRQPGLLRLPQQPLGRILPELYLQTPGLARRLLSGGPAMARSLRFITEGGALVEVTTRTFQSRLLLTPKPLLNRIILGVLARASHRYGVGAVAFAFLSNHYHLLVWIDDARQLARFMNFFNSKLAREIGRLTGWKQKVWSRRYQAIVISEEREAQEGRLAYVLAHGVKEGLVARVEEWPGVHAAPALLSGLPLEGVWYDRTKEYLSKIKGKKDRSRPLCRDRNAHPGAPPLLEASLP